jgi:hypothetical protein
MEVQDLCESETKWKPVRIGSTKWWMSPKMVDLSNKNIVFCLKKLDLTGLNWYSHPQHGDLT